MNKRAAQSAVRRTRVGVVTQLCPRGVLARDSLDELRAGIIACINERQLKLMLDLSAVPLIDSVALEYLVDVQDELMRLGGWLKLAKANALLREVFRLTGFGEYVGVEGVERPRALSSTGAVPRLGDLLIAKEMLTEQRVAEAIRLQDTLGKRMGQIIVERGWVPEEDLLQVLGEQLTLPYVRLRPGIYDPDVVALLEPSTARRLRVLPLYTVRGALYLATSDPQALHVLDEVQERTGFEIRPVLACSEHILKAVGEQGGLDELTAGLIGDVDGDLELIHNTQPDDYAAIDEVAAGSPVVNLVNSLIQRAVHDGASDIHIEPFRTLSRVRFRIDGVLYEYSTLRAELHPSLVSRLKVMANLDIAERRLPQDGRIQVHTHGRSIDLRFSSLPGLFGEKVVLRVLDRNSVLLDVEKLGMNTGTLSSFKQLLGRSHGLILVTGPTGSGKTTTLYAALSMLNSIERGIVTIEDPVEYQLEVINQNEVRPGIGLNFAKLLKHVLRQDPDIIMVGEIRERETAEIAVQAALTGHLVLSTLHTNDSLGAVTRLVEMGVEPYLLSSALIGVLAQRLVRGICPKCKTTFQASAALKSRLGWNEESLVLARGRGCAECYDSGHKGRLAIHELLQVDAELQQLIISSPSRDTLERYLESAGIRTLHEDGLARVTAQDTTLEELSRVVLA